MLPRPLFALVLATSACAGLFGPKLRRPEVAFRSVEVSGIDLEGATLTFGLDVDNPNSVELSVVRLSWQLSISGHSFAEGTLPEAVRLPEAGPATPVWASDLCKIDPRCF